MQPFIFSDFVEINPTISLKGKGAYSFVEMKDLNDGQRYAYPSQERTIAGGARFGEGDTLFARITPCLENGKICQVKGLKDGVGFGSTEFLVFRERPGISDKDFIFYLSRWDEVRRYAELHLVGTSGRQRVPKDVFDKLELELPDLPTQHRIASILSALDDKIELNRQMNQTLEQMAQTLFRQYFVEPITLANQSESALRPSEHEKLSLGSLAAEEAFTPANREENGITLQEAKNLPSGWKIGKVGEVSCIQNGFAFKSKDFLEEGQNGVIKIRNINGNVVDVHSTQFIDDKVAATIAPRFHVSSGDILIAMTGAEVGKIGIVPNTEKKLFLNQRVGSFKERIANGNYFTYLLLTSEAYQAELQTTAMGSAQPNISGTDIESIKCPLPYSEVITEFGEQVKPLFDKILQNLKENFLLSTTRDTLLPKLMSGEINVLQAAKTGAYEPEQVLS